MKNLLYNNQNRALKASYSFVWMSIYVGITSLFPFITRSIMINFMGIEYAGLNSLFNSILNVLNLSELGIGEALVYFLYKPMADKNENLVNSLLNVYKRLYTLIGVIILIISIIIAPFLPYLIKDSYPQEINLYFLYFLNVLAVLVSYFCFAYSLSIFQTNQALYIDYRVRSLIWIITYCIQILIIYKFKNYYIYCLSFVICNVFLNLSDFILGRKYFPSYKPKGDVDKSFFKELFNKVFAIIMYKIRTVCRNSFDSIIVSAYLGLEILAKYYNYYVVMLIPQTIRGIFGKVVLQSLGNSIAVESKESNYSVVNLYSFIVQWISSLGAIVLICIFRIFMICWVGNNSTFSITTEFIFALYFYISQIPVIASVVRDSAGLWTQGKWFSIVEALFNLVLDIILVRYFSINGILIATIVSILIFNIPVETYIVFKKYFGKKISKVFFEYLYNFIVTVFLMVTCYKITLHLFYDWNWYTVFLKVIICILLANIFLFIFHIFDKRMWEIGKLIISILKEFRKRK